MAKGHRLYRYVEVDDKTPVQKLKLMDQLRLLLRKLTEDPANELKADDAVTAEYLKLKADCTDFLKKATKPLREGTRSVVYVQISNQFKPVLKAVLQSNDIRNYYDVRLAKPKVDYDIPMEYLVEMRNKQNLNEVNYDG